MAEYDNPANDHIRRVEDTGRLPDAELAGQLRAYADAWVATAYPLSASEPVVVGRSRGPRRSRVLTLAAACVTLIVALGTLIWNGPRGGTESVESVGEGRAIVDQTPDDDSGAGDPDSEPAELDGAESQLLEASQYLMPDTAAWALTSVSPLQATEGGDPIGGTWAWRVDGELYLLVEGVDLGASTSLDVADVQVDADVGRATIGWSEGGQQLGLQSYGAGAEKLRAVADTLARSGDGWELPGAEVVVAEPAAVTSGGSSIQAQYGALDSRGIVDLGATVDVVRSPGTTAELYRSLFDASSVAPLVEVSIERGTAFVMQGPFASSGLMARDGWLWSVHASGPGIDLVSFVQSLSPVSAEAWDGSVAQVDQVVEQAVAGSTAVPGGDIDVLDPANDPELPRFVLPEPWTLNIVTDAGLWSAEERRQREQLVAANTSGFGSELLLTQMFASAASPEQPGGFPGLSTPDFVVKINRHELAAHDRPTDDPSRNLISVAGLEGEVISFMPEPGTGTADATGSPFIIASQGLVDLTIDGLGKSAAELVAFAETLQIRSDQLADGVVSVGRDYPMIRELTGSAGDGAGFYHRWVASFTDSSDSSGSSDGTRDAWLLTESLSGEQSHLKMFEIGGPDVLHHVDGGRYLGSEYEFITTSAEAGGRDVSQQRAMVVSYDTATQTFISLDAPGSLDDVVALVKQLEQVELDEWRELVEPYNAQPLKPR